MNSFDDDDVILESKSIYTGILRHSMVEKGRNDDMEEADTHLSNSGL